MSSERDERRSIVAGERGVAIGGSADGSVIITGDNAQVHRGATLEDFLDLLDKLRAELRASELDADTRDDLADEVASVESLAKRETPNPSMILGKLRTIGDTLEGARKVGVALIPMARQLGEMASFLF